MCRSNSLAVSGLMVAVGFAASASAQVSVLTNCYNNQRTAANLNETALTQSNVTPGSFGLLFSLPVDGQLYAQPLYVPQVAFPDGSTHNVLVLATENDTVYAFDADSAQAPLWSNHLGTAAQGSDTQCNDLLPIIGITGTPVIDPATQTIYVIDMTEDSSSNFHEDLHALDLLTGQDRLTALPIDQSITSQNGGTTIAFDPQVHFNRPGLMLLNGVVYAGFGSHCDVGNYYGWLIGFDAQTLAPTQVFNTTPNGGQGAIWQSGGGVASDSQGNLYAGTGNGTADWASGGPDVGESVVKWSASLSVLDYFTPAAADSMSGSDTDMGSTPMVIDEADGLVVSGDKGGSLRIFAQDNLGQQTPGDTGPLQTLSFSAGLFVGPVLWQAPTGLVLYAWSSGEHLHRYTRSGGQFAMDSVSGSVDAPSGKTGGVLTLSANGSQPGTGIIWGSVPAASSDGSSVAGSFYAFSAEDVSQDLWDSTQNPADDVGTFAKFSAPTVANGKVYLPTFSGALNVYGLFDGGTSGTGSGTGASTGTGTGAGTTAGTSTAAGSSAGTGTGAGTGTESGANTSNGTATGHSHTNTGSATSASSTGRSPSTGGAGSGTSAAGGHSSGASSGAIGSTAGSSGTGQAASGTSGNPTDTSGKGCGCTSGADLAFQALPLVLASRWRRRRRPILSP